MTYAPLPEMLGDLPPICGFEEQVASVTSGRQPVFLAETNLRLDRLRAAFAVALHMHQPLVPAGGSELRTAALISHLDFMMRHPNQGDNHNAPVFAECYARAGDTIPDQPDAKPCSVRTRSQGFVARYAGLS